MSDEQKPTLLKSFLTLFKSVKNTGSKPFDAMDELPRNASDNQQVLNEEMLTEVISIKETTESAPVFNRQRAPKNAGVRKVSAENRGWSNDDAPDNYFKGKTVLITGVLLLLGERDSVAGLLKSLGARVTSSVSSKTQVIVIGQDPGPSKLEKASLLQSEGIIIHIMSELELILKLHDAGVDLLSFVTPR